jgi:hypothetical protein
MARPEFNALSGDRPAVRVTGTPTHKAHPKTLRNTRRIIKPLYSIKCAGIQPVCHGRPTPGDPGDSGCSHENWKMHKFGWTKTGSDKWGAIVEMSSAA